jgi:Helix-turn-helix domain
MTESPFRRNRVSPVAEVPALLSIEAGKPSGSGYVQVRCPIHGESNTSLSVNIERGNWRRFACGEARGDAPELYRRARGISHPATRIKELDGEGYQITTSDPMTAVDSDGFMHRGVALYSLVGEPDTCDFFSGLEVAHV